MSLRALKRPPRRADAEVMSAAGADVPLDPRILLVDDNSAIHEDIRKILAAPGAQASALDAIEADLFGGGDPGASAATARWRIDSAYQGQQALTMVQAAIAEQSPYAVAFVDVRMPPGWDGIETIGHLWNEDPDLQIVICTAFSDHSWSEIVAKLAPADGLLILRKPFDSIEIRQMVHALSAKWLLRRELAGRMADLERIVDERTAALVSANDQLRQQILDRARLESELNLAHRLETVGQLASGLAHEAGAPLASVMDSVRTLRLAFQDLTTLVERYRRLLLTATTAPGMGHLMDELRRAEEAVDLLELQREVPQSFARIAAEAGPVTELVHAVQEVVRETGEHGTIAQPIVGEGTKPIAVR